MGYSTEFEGAFTIERELTGPELIALAAARQESEGPGGYCQWVLKGGSLQWDQEEKFRDYIEWLSHLVEEFFIPRRIGISGSVTWQGEESSDRGVLKVVNGEVVAFSVDDNPCPHCKGSGIVEGQSEITNR